ncbi:hypothetical protein AX16_006547 [Volvariella volvacea WC 439]|nr:hypothetical protein AX16_006547 [Volvariella volvacea WC 439]
MALGDPKLWTYIRTTNLRGFTAFLERSELRPLDIDTVGSGPLDEGWETSDPEGRHTPDDPNYSDFDRYMCERLLWLRNIPAPHLEVLQFHEGGPYGPPNFDVRPNVMLRLRQLRVYSFGRAWQSLLPPHLPSVTDIVLDGANKEGLDVLSLCPTVRKLSIHCWQTSWVFELSPILSPRLHDSFGELHNVADCLDFLLLTQVKIETCRGCNLYHSDRCFSLMKRVIEIFTKSGQARTRIHHLSLAFDNCIKVLRRDSVGDDLVSFAFLNRFSPDLQAFSIVLLVQLAQSMDFNLQPIHIQPTSGALTQIQHLFYELQHISCITTIHIDNPIGLIGLLLFINPDNQLPEAHRSLLVPIEPLDIRREKNQLRPISKLPPALITKILAYLVNHANTTIEWEGCFSHPLWPDSVRIFGLLPATHFCAQWRELALGDPSLWTHIWATNSKWFRACIERSKGELLHIDTWSDNGRVKGTKQDEMLQLIAMHMHRVRSLHLRLGVTQDRALVLCNVLAPQLEVLIFSGSPSTVSSPSGPIRPDVFPKLRRLEMHDCSGDAWTCFLPSRLPTVIEIVLRGINLPNQIAMLSCCPNVRRLSIIDGQWTSIPDPTSLQLLDLQHLHVSRSHWAFLECLTLPSVTRVTIDTTSTYLMRENAPSAISVLEKLLTSLQSSPDSNPQPHHASIVFESLALTITVSDSTGEPLVALTATEWPWPAPLNLSYFSEFLYRLEQLLRLTHTGARSIAIRSKHDADSLIRAFQSHLPVSTVQVYSRRAFVQFGIFSTVIRPMFHPDGADGDPPCDCEECHEACMMTYSGVRRLVYDTVDEGAALFADEEELRCFVEWLEERRARGVGLEELVLRSVGGGLETATVWVGLQRIRAIVPRVVVEV